MKYTIDKSKTNFLILLDSSEKPYSTNENAHSTCLYNGKRYELNEEIKDGCTQICQCNDNSEVTCRPRCPKMNHTTSEQCVTFRDPNDSCCEIELCDVTLDDHEQSPIVIVPPPMTTEPSIIGKNSSKGHCEHKNKTYTIGKLQLCIYICRTNLTEI